MCLYLNQIKKGVRNSITKGNAVSLGVGRMKKIIEKCCFGMPGSSGNRYNQELLQTQPWSFPLLEKVWIRICPAQWGCLVDAPLPGPGGIHCNTSLAQTKWTWQLHFKMCMFSSFCSPHTSFIVFFCLLGLRPLFLFSFSFSLNCLLNNLNI